MASANGAERECSSYCLYNPGGCIRNNLGKKKEKVIINLGQFPSLSHGAAA